MTTASNRVAALTTSVALAIALAATGVSAQQGGGAAGGQGAGAAAGQGRQGGGGQGRGGRGGRGAAAAPSAPTPRWPDGKPILGSVPGQRVGGWGAGVTTLPQGQLDKIPFQPWAKAVYDIRQIDQFEPHTRCKASGVSRQFSTPYGTEFVEAPDLQRMYIMDNGGATP